METVASYPNHINKNSLSLLPSPPPLDGKLVHPGFTPSIQFTCSHFVYTWMKRGTVSQKGLAQEHNTASLTRAQTRTR